MLISPVSQIFNLKNIFDFGNINLGPSTLLDTPLYSSIDLNNVFLAFAILGSLTIVQYALLTAFDKLKIKQK